MPMKNMTVKNLMFILGLFLVGLSSCSNDSDYKEESTSVEADSISIKGSEIDEITASTGSFEFPHTPDTVTVSVEAEEWWVDSVALKDLKDSVIMVDRQALTDDDERVETFKWLTVRRNGGELELVVEDNYSIERYFWLRLVNESDTLVLQGTQAEAPTGKWPDLIGLSEKNLELSGDWETVRISTKGQGWWINAIRLDGEMKYMPTLGEKEKLAATGEFYTQCDWLEVKCENYDIIISVGPNNVVKERTFRIELEAGDYFDAIEGRQKEMPVPGFGPSPIVATPDSLTLATEGGISHTDVESPVGWNVCQIDIDGETYSMTLEERMKYDDEHEFEKTVKWLTVKHDGTGRITVCTEPNNTGQERKFEVLLESGNWYEHIYGVQAAK